MDTSFENMYKMNETELMLIYYNKEAVAAIKFTYDLSAKQVLDWYAEKFDRDRSKLTWDSINLVEQGE